MVEWIQEVLGILVGGTMILFRKQLAALHFRVFSLFSHRMPRDYAPAAIRTVRIFYAGLGVFFAASSILILGLHMLGVEVT